MLNGRARAGFTLIEILIVAALISLLAGIAAINIQRAYVDSQRKATFGEAKNIATALSFAKQDTGVFPKLCFLQQNIYFIAPRTTPPYNQPGPDLLSGFESIGWEVNQPATLTERIKKSWAQGLGSQGYFSPGSGRRGMFQGRRGGTVKMQVLTAGYNPQVPLGPAPIYDWPADPWGRPYVVYMLVQEGMRVRRMPDGSNRLVPNVRWPANASESPNYTLAVVSYGPNGFPGGPADYDTAYLQRGNQRCLFIRDPAVVAAGADYRCLNPYAGEYTQDRLDAWSHVKLLGEDPPTYIGVADPFSDDIIIDIP